MKVPEDGVNAHRGVRHKNYFIQLRSYEIGNLLPRVIEQRLVFHPMKLIGIGFNPKGEFVDRIEDWFRGRPVRAYNEIGCSVFLRKDRPLYPAIPLLRLMYSGSSA